MKKTILENQIKSLLEESVNNLKDIKEDKIVVEFESYYGNTCEGYLFNRETNTIEQTHDCGNSSGLIESYPKTTEFFDYTDIDCDYLFDTGYNLIRFQAKFGAEEN